MVYGVWFMVYGQWFMVYSLWFMVYGVWFMVYGLWFWVLGLGFRVPGFGFRVQGFVTIDLDELIARLGQRAGGYLPKIRVYLTQSVSEVVLQKSIPAQIRQRILYYY